MPTATCTQTVPMQTTMPLQPSRQLHVQTVPMQTMMPSQPSQQLYQQVPTPWSNNNPFVVTTLTSRIKKCSGCHIEFRNPVGPPFIGLVVRHVERDHYMDKSGQYRIANEANHYYHCSLQCIKVKHPYFHAGLLLFENQNMLDEIQVQYIKQEFGL